jgi:two-component system, OmpR family, sensor histidine kinase VanS
MSELPAGSPRAGAHVWHASVRARLAGMAALLLALFGVVVVALVYLGMRFLPSYQFTPVTTTGTALRSMASVAHAAAAPALTTAGAADFVISSPGQISSALLLIGGVSLAFTVADGALAAWLVARRFLRPLDALARASAAFGGGDLAHRAPGAGRPDEFGAVTRAFNTMLDRAERVLASNQRFAANASHELRSPLATAKTLLDVARQEPAAVDLPVLLAKLTAANDRSIALVDALLDLADAGRADVDLAAVDLAATVADVVREGAAEAAGLGVEVHCRLHPSHATANVPLLRQAVGNLLTNAVRHNLAGGRVSAETGTAPDDRVYVRVSNTGPVVDPAVVDLLGEPFYRVRPRARSAGQRDSHGLGLPIALAITEALGGRLALTANPGGGLTAELSLPGNGAAARPW